MKIVNRYRPLIVMLLALNFSATALAHKVNMFAFVEGNEVFVEGYFTDGVKPKHSPVTVYDATGQQLLAGQTNDEGQYSFTPPIKDQLRITINAGEGHMAEYVLSKQELLGNDLAESQPEMAKTDMNIAPATTGQVSQAELKNLVQVAVGQALRPVMRSLSELKERRTISDIIGGIGIIMGIAGAFFYVQARKLTKQKSS